VLPYGPIDDTNHRRLSTTAAVKEGKRFASCIDIFGLSLGVFLSN
jgi:hypothetical protein